MSSTNPRERLHAPDTRTDERAGAQGIRSVNRPPDEPPRTATPPANGRLESAGRSHRIPVRTTRWLLAGVAVAVVAGGAWAVLASRDDADVQAGAAGGAAPGMGGMEGMAGMSMSSDGSVTLTADQLRTFGITYGTADVRTLETQVRTAGAVTFDETRLAQVAPRVGGFVERLYVDITEQPVRRGQPLLELYSPELVAAQQELLVAARLDRSIGESAVPGVPSGTTELVEAAKRRFALWDISEAQVNEVLRTGRPTRTMTLYAPASGVVTEKNVVRGQSVAPGEHLYTIADPSEVWVDVELRGADAASVRRGSVADIEVTGLPGRTFTGPVKYVYPTVEEEARTVRARVAVPNPDGLLKPGMYATVRLSTPSRRALTVPSSAVIRTGERSLVFVDMGGGRLMPHEVELGRTAGDYTEILSGVEPGQRVVTSAQFLLESESNIGEVMKAMMGQMGAGGSPQGGQMGGMGDMDMSGGDAKGADMQGMDGMDMKGADVKGMKDMPGMTTSPAAPTRR